MRLLGMHDIDQNREDDCNGDDAAGEEVDSKEDDTLVPIGNNLYLSLNNQKNNIKCNYDYVKEK